jgi:arabinofuranosyltransferase
VLADDAMISMTYAKNLVHGFGLNWARFGAPVEGYTHPLWTLVMIPVHLVGMPLRVTSLVMSIVSLGCLVANLWAVHRLVRTHFAGEKVKRTWPALALTASCLALDFWALRGMETGLQALLVTLLVQAALDTASGKPRYVALGTIAGLSVLLRIDMLLACALVVAFLVVARAPVRGFGRELLVGAGIFLGLNGAYELFRVLYFGDWLPNTYYLKMHGVPFAMRWHRGYKAMLEAIRPLWPAALVFAGAGLLLREMRKPTLLLAAIVVGYAGYSAYVGGDVWEGQPVFNRFMAFTIPLVFVGANGVTNFVEERLRARALPGFATVGLAFAAVAVLFMSANGLWRFPKHDDMWKQLTLRAPIFEMKDMRGKYVEMKNLDKLITPDARIAVTWAGLTAYFTDYQMVDVLGYNDRVIAHGPIRVDEKMFLPGHTKADYDHMLGELAPDLVTQWLYRFGPVPTQKYGYEQQGQYLVKLGSAHLRATAK